MTRVYIPVYRTTIHYSVSVGRRWSVLEHLILVRLAAGRQTTEELVKACNVPSRVVIEALINLLRVNWIEVRSSTNAIYFSATPIGVTRVGETTLPAELQSDSRWVPMCLERVTGTWLRAEDLDLVHERDIDDDALRVVARVNTFDSNAAGLRELLPLNADEGLEPKTPVSRAPSRLFAVVDVSLDDPAGLPSYATVELRRAVIEAASSSFDTKPVISAKPPTYAAPRLFRADVNLDDFLVGGEEHLSYLQGVLAKARSQVVIHSCFLNEETVLRLLPDFEKAARRKVRIDLLYGLRADAEENDPKERVTKVREMLSRLDATIRGRLQLSLRGSGSHAKIVLSDSLEDDRWHCLISSCNLLSTQFDAIELSLHTTSTGIVSEVIAHLLASQLPAAGDWPSVARRLNAIWGEVRKRGQDENGEGSHQLALVVDGEHYEIIRHARNVAKTYIHLGCDIFGMAADTAALVPMQTAKERGVSVRLNFQRPSRFLTGLGVEPEQHCSTRYGLSLTRHKELHAKFLAWDETNVVISSFNWLATALSGGRSRGLEIGVLVSGPVVGEVLKRKLHPSLAAALSL